MLILARLLSPKAYGQFGLVNDVIVFLGVLSVDSFLQHILQVRKDEEVNYQQHFTAGGLIQVGLFIVTNLVGFALRWSTTYAEIALLINVMSVLFLISWPSSLRMRMLERDLNWKRLRLLHGVSLLGSAIIAVTFAACGAGVFALLIPAWLKHLVFTYDLFLVEGWRPTWEWNWSRYSQAFSFGLSRIATGILGAGKELLESGWLVQAIGFVNFGYYGRALGLAQIFCGKYSFVLIQAIYPVLTKIEPGTSAYARANNLILRSVVWVILPVGLVLSAVAEPLIRVVYGVKWFSAVPLVPWAIAATCIGAIAHVSYMLLLAAQKQKHCLVIDSGMFLASFLALIFVLPHGLIAYLIFLAALQTTKLVLILLCLNYYEAASIKKSAGAILFPAVAASLATLTCEAVRRLGPGGTLTVFQSLMYGLVFSLVYLSVLRLLFAAQLNELLSYAPHSRYLARALGLPGNSLRQSFEGVPD
jgi:O-antigen/teichoic acid export membrane protein